MVWLFNNFLFRVLSLFGGFQCWFLHTMKKYSVMHWGLEQKWLALILMPMLIMYNGKILYLIFSLFKIIDAILIC